MTKCNHGDNGLLRQQIVAILAFYCAMLAGCGSPSSSNIELRKQQQVQQETINHLNNQHDRDVEAIIACQKGHPTTQTLSPTQLANLVTVHGIKFGELTGGSSADATSNVDDRLKVYVVPVDGDSVPIKAAGIFKVEAYDLANPANPLIESWQFSSDQAKNLFYNQLLLYTFVLDCPWKKYPTMQI